MKRTLLTWFCVALICFAASWALFRPGMFKIHDFIHGARITEMTLALQDGHFPARWSKHFGYGYGMPLFEFYAPLPYYVGSFLYQLGLPLVTSVKSLFFLSTFVTAVGSYLLGRELFKRRSAGVLTSAAITLAPYRALNLFVRGAVSESWGMMAIPWIAYGILLSRREKWHGFFVITAAIFVLLTSHNLTSLIALPFILVFVLAALFVLPQKPKKVADQLRVGVRVAAAGVLGFSLSAFYSIPAFLEKNATQIETTILSGYFNYSLHFLYIRQFFRPIWGYGGSEWGPDDPISFYLGAGQLLALFLSFTLFLVFIVKKAKKKRIMRVVTDSRSSVVMVFAVLLVLSLFMSLQRSLFVWNAVPLLAYIQFPWRFLSVSSLFLGVFAGVPILFLSAKNMRLYTLVLLVVLIGWNTPYFRPESYLADATGLYYDNGERVAAHMSEVLPDYIPRGVQVLGLEPPTAPLTCLEPCTYVVEVDRTHERLYRFTAFTTERQLVFSIADYPGWKVFADGVEIPHTQSDGGFISADIPAATELVGVQFQQTGVRAFSDGVSLLGCIVLISLLFYQQRTDLFKESVDV